MTWLRETADGVELLIRLQPNSSRNEIVGELNGRLKIKLTAPAVDGKANSALIEFLSDKLDCPKSVFQIIRGQHSREKTVSISTMPSRETIRILSSI